ncbi:MAG: hypothetical protein ABI193_18500 [Minicystis sp.]
MLARNLFGFFGLGAVLAASALGGCIIKTEPTGAGGSSSTASTTATTATGQGGEPTGTGGTSTVATTGTGGTAGGDCVGIEGPHTVADCETMNITPAPNGAASSSCGDTLDQDPPGYLVCVHAFSIFTSGAASDLQDCLALIGVQDECTDEKWQACIDAMYKDACQSQDIVDACAGIANACGADPLDTTRCAEDLNPFSNQGLQSFQDCFNGLPNDTCQDAYDACITEVLTASK